MVVDKDKILMDLRRFFVCNLSQITIDDQGLVSCSGNVELTARLARLPVQFDRIEGWFKVSKTGLTTLVGCPRFVRDTFDCNSNPITSWEGAPRVVLNTVFAQLCQITNLKGAPQCYSLFVDRNPLTALEGIPKDLQMVTLSYDPHLPMLQALAAQKISISTTSQFARAGETCEEILNKYAGTIDPGDILNCRDELVDAGFEGNAEW